MADASEVLDFEFPGDPSKYPTTTKIPLGVLGFEVLEVKGGRTAEAKLGEVNRQGRPKVGNKYKVTFSLKVLPGIEAQKDYAGLVHTQDIIVGTDDDPDALKPSTVHRNFTLGTQLFQAAKTVLTKNSAQAFAAIKNQQVQGRVTLEKSKDPQYADKHKVSAFFTLGTKEIKVLGNEDDGIVMEPVKVAVKEFVGE